jgi:uncharacterized protein YggE
LSKVASFRVGVPPRRNSLNQWFKSKLYLAWCILSSSSDLFVLNLGVQTQAKTASDALASNSQVMNQVVDAMKKAGLKGRELSTGAFSVQALYNYSKDSATVLSGYTSTNTLTITTNHTDLAGRYIDVAVSAGANQVTSSTSQSRTSSRRA